MCASACPRGSLRRACSLGRRSRAPALRRARAAQAQWQKLDKATQREVALQGLLASVRLFGVSFEENKEGIVYVRPVGPRRSLVLAGSGLPLAACADEGAAERCAARASISRQPGRKASTGERSTSR